MGEEIQTSRYHSVLSTQPAVCFLSVKTVKSKAKHNSFNNTAFEATCPACDFRDKRSQCHSVPCSLAVAKFIPRKPRVNPLIQKLSWHKGRSKSDKQNVRADSAP